MKKIKKGFILLLIVLVALTVYLVNLERQRIEDKEIIKEKCEEFVSIIDKYSVLPEEMQKYKQGEEEKNTEYEKNIDKYVEKLEAELKEVMPSNEEGAKIQKQVLEEHLREGYTSLDIRTNEKRTIKRVKKYQFDGNKVTVELQNEVQQSIKYSNGIEEQTETITFEPKYDSVTLEKIDDKWKVVDANLQFNQNQHYNDYEINN